MLKFFSLIFDFSCFWIFFFHLVIILDNGKREVNIKKREGRGGYPSESYHQIKQKKWVGKAEKTALGNASFFQNPAWTRSVENNNWILFQFFIMNFRPKLLEFYMIVKLRSSSVHIDRGKEQMAHIEWNMSVRVPSFFEGKKTKKKNFREAKKIFPWDFWDFKFWSGTNVNISLCEA